MLFAIHVFLESYNCTTATPVYLYNACQQSNSMCMCVYMVMECIYWWLQVLTCIIILDYWFQWQFEEGG